MYSDIKQVGADIRNFCINYGVNIKIQNDIELALIEALNNVIKHSYKMDKNGKVIVEWNVTENVLEIRITDFGIARTNFDKPKLEYDHNDINSLPEGGMGLFIIDNLMDENFYETDGTKNTFTLKKKLIP